MEEELPTCIQGTLGGASTVNLSNVYLDFTKMRSGKLRASSSMKGVWIMQKSIRLEARRNADLLTVCCGPSSEAVKKLEDGSREMKSIKKSHVIPKSFEVESLLTQICDTTTIAEFDLKLGDFHLYVTRDLTGKSEPPLPSTSAPIKENAPVEIPASNGSVSSLSLVLALAKPKTSLRIQRLLETAADEGLVIVKSSRVGYFRTSQTIKGMRAPPACKENQIVKEGKALCFIEQLGGEIPIKGNVAGEVIKILRVDGEPVGYGDALIAILPSFPGIKYLH